MAAYRLTNALRWRKPSDNALIALTEAINGKYDYILQQAWECVETGEVEWLDVPGGRNKNFVLPATEHEGT